MNRNTNMFAYNRPYLDISRSKFKRNCDHKTTMNAARLVPIYVDELLPGDSVKMNMTALVRMSTPIYPVMDNAYMDTYFFAIPERLVWEHWVNMMGENDTDYWTENTEYEMPTIKNNKTTGWEKGSLADYLGIPIGVSGLEVRADIMRACALVYNSWFRDENNVEPQHIYLDDTNRTIASDAVIADINKVEYGIECPKVAKFADYFTTALPQPQKGDAVRIPLGTTAPLIENDVTKMFKGKTSGAEGFLVINANGTPGQTISQPPQLRNNSTPNVGFQAGEAIELLGDNFTVDLSNATSATINQLRQAFAVQKLFERDAIGGTRYTETIRAHFGCTSPDARQQRPEYVGGGRVQINMTQVLQQSATDETSPQGNTAAYSLTVDSRDMVNYSATEHMLLIGFACIRTEHTYQQGLERFWGRRNRFDWYWPVFANLGNQFIRNEEIYAQGTDEDKEAFGYQEAWAEYRYKPSRVSGEMRSTYSAPLDSWHYADYFESLPTLSKTFIEETDANIARTLAVQTQDQFICDFYFRGTWTRPMPVNSVPGLIDHH